jgi:hypothetical protein
VFTGSRLTVDRLQGGIRRMYGRHYRLSTLVEKIAARGSRPRVILRIAVPTQFARRAQSLLPQGELVEVGVALAEEIRAAGEVLHVPLVDLFGLNRDGLAFVCL